MKLFSYLTANTHRLGVVIGDECFDLNRADNRNADNMADFLEGGETAMERARDTIGRIKNGTTTAMPLTSVTFAAPVPKPSSCRDAYAFRQHVETARRNRGVPMIPEFDRFPV